MMLIPEGRLVYSTCTFSPEENEGRDRIVPPRAPGFYADRIAADVSAFLPGRGAVLWRCSTARAAGRGDSCALFAPEGERIPAFDAFWRETFAIEPPSAMLLPDGRVMIPPSLLPRERKGLHIVRAGTPGGGDQGRAVRARPRARDGVSRKRVSEVRLARARRTWPLPRGRNSGPARRSSPAGVRRR